MVKFVTTNAQTCGIPAEAVKQMKANHDRTLKAADQVCSQNARPAEADRPGPERGARHRARRHARSDRAAERHARHADRERARPMSEAAAASPTPPETGSIRSRRHGHAPICASRAPTGRSAHGCCCCPAGGRRDLRRSRPGSPYPNPWHVALFFIGAFVMRGAGCTWNDILDRDLDAKVARTRSRPIPSGQVSVKAAAVFLVAQALVGLAVLIQFNRFTILVGIASLGVVAIYPLMKRIICVAADRARPRLFVGRADGLGRGVLAARCAGAPALCRLDRLGDRLRHDLRASGPRGRRADRREIDRAAVRRAHAARAGRASTRSPSC